MNWLNLIAAIPLFIQGAQIIHADKPGTTKKEKVMQWLGLGIGTAVATGAVNPEQAQGLAGAVSNVSKIIDEMVALFHNTNAAPGFGATPLPAGVVGGKGAPQQAGVISGKG